MNRSAVSGLALAIVISAVVAFGGTSRGTTVTYRRAADVLAYAHNWTVAYCDHNNIMVARGDGTEPKVLIKDASMPSWSPDGKKIAFTRKGFEIWAANADGSNPHRIYRADHRSAFRDATGEFSFRPDWNPRTREVFFGEQKSEGVGGIFYLQNNWQARDIHDLQPGTRGGMTVGGFSHSYFANPAWSPDGTRMAYVCNGDIWMAALDSTSHEFEPGSKRWHEKSNPGPLWDKTRVEACAVYDDSTWHAECNMAAASSLCWSKDGTRLAYSCAGIGSKGMNSGAVLDLGERDVQRVRLGECRDVAFCPDGKTLSLVRFARNGQSNLVLRSEDGRETPIIRNAYFACWKPE
jgi:dipeptidyl aminopeptidase/acylaminoacyl peptidase